MKKTLSTILICGAALASAPLSWGDVPSLPEVSIENVALVQEGELFQVDMLMGLQSLDVKANQAVILTPVLVHDTDSLELPSVGIYGRTRYYQYQRGAGDGMISGPREIFFKASEAPDSYSYSQIVPFSKWMDGSTLVVRRTDYGCCRRMTAQASGDFATFTGAWFPELVYVTPAAKATKTREINGSAFVDFPVNVSEIRPDYRSNRAELGKITASIDTVKTDRDATVTSVWLKGYASPEGPWDNNVRLARERTESLKGYVNRLYSFPSGIMKTDYEPEDWDGLRKYVAASDLAHKSQILKDIDSDLAPDAKEWRIKSTYPEEYRFLLDNVYPGLRHTDYRISYSLRHYSDVNEIRRVLQERPQNLDLDEFYMLAAEYEPGTPEFTEVYETAVRMYPGDPIANLNAANAAMRRGDNDAAARYLAKAGDSAEAVYTRAALEIRKNNIPEARTLLNQALAMGFEQAAATLKQLR